MEHLKSFGIFDLLSFIFLLGFTVIIVSAPPALILAAISERFNDIINKIKSAFVI